MLKGESPWVRVEGNTLVLSDRAGRVDYRALEQVDRVEILEDTKSVEVFINGGENSFTFWLE